MSENRDSCPVVFCETPEEFDRVGPGAMMADKELLAGEPGVNYLYLRLPDGSDAGALGVSRDPAECGNRVWRLVGDPREPETVTLQPSIHLVGSWHGFLRNGRLESC